MTPHRLLALVQLALARTPTDLDVQIWAEALACPPHLGCPPTDCVHDTEAEQALRLHLRSSRFTPTPAEVRELAVALANRRVEDAQRAERDAGVENAVPPTAEYLAAKAEWDRQQELRRQQLDGAIESDEERAVRRERARAAADAELMSGSPS